VIVYTSSKQNTWHIYNDNGLTIMMMKMN